jgi:hypothetical protein
LLARFTTDVRIARVGVSLEVGFGGLTACSGHPVELGLYSATGSPMAVGFALVDDEGRGAASVIPSEESLDAFPGVRGDCIDDAVLLAEAPIPVIDPPSPAAGEPSATPFPGNERVSFQWEGRAFVGESVVLAVNGLGEQCAGKVVQLGFFAGLFGPELSESTSVDGTGHAIVELTPTEPTGDQRAGVLGECLVNGFAISHRSFGADQPLPGDEIGHTPTPATPQPPEAFIGT